MKDTMSFVVAVLFFEFLAIATININFCNGSSYVGCIESERETLLRFKQDLIDPSNRLASWSGDGDCCTWAGVVCNNLTGHVLELHLRNPFNHYGDSEYEAYERSQFAGKINPSLLGFKHLIYLDLSGNNFEGIQIPRFLGSMENLRYLNLSRAQFVGMVPHQLGNLSNLQYLDLGNNDMGSLYVENFSWLSSLSSLHHLDLSGVDLAKLSDWLLMINKLSSLVVLQLSECQLHYFPPLTIGNFSSLAILDLSNNEFDDSLIPAGWICGLSHLLFLDLSNNKFQGPIPDELQNLTSLRHLDLSYNHFSSSLPNWLSRYSRLEYLSLSSNSLHGSISRSLTKLCNLKSIFLSNIKLSQEISEVLDVFSGCISHRLESLDLSNNQLFGHLTNDLGMFKNLITFYLYNNFISGPISLSLGELSSLEILNLSNNKLNGTLSEIHFANLTRLLTFYACENSLIIKVNPNWVPPFQLKKLGLRSCHLGPRFPIWLLSQKHLKNLDISNSEIVDTIPGRFWNSLSHFIHLNLSHNQIYGKIPNLTEAIILETLDFSSNNLSGPLPLISSNVYGLDLSNNDFSGSISHFLCHQMNESKRMKILNLRNNFLSGELPNCWMNWRDLHVLNLGDNKFTGNLPVSIGTLSSLEYLLLHRNNLSGTIPMALENCTKLVVICMTGNKFVGNIPKWIGKRVSNLMLFSFRSNKFSGMLPIELCLLVSIQILDLADNNLSGTIPKCINNFSAMVTMNYSMDNRIHCPNNSTNFFVETAILMMKGRAIQYSYNLYLVRNIDLSKNNFSGKIPTEVSNLQALQSLNLSHNSFIGRIPKTIGTMRSLECLDLSTNQLSGKIPQDISSLTFLNHLNVSNNNLTGEIPSSTQLQSFDASCFIGNDLCGSPLPKNCTVSDQIRDHRNGKGKAGIEDEVSLFYVSMVLGFVVGFWSVIGPLFFNRRWRYVYYHFLDRLWDKFCSVLRKHC